MIDLTKPMTYAKRGQLPMGGVPWTGPASLDTTDHARVRTYDPMLELIFNPHRSPTPAVELYRVKSRGACSSDDELVHQHTFFNPPKGGLLSWLQMADQWKHFGSVDKAVKGQLKFFDDNELLRDEQQSSKAREIAGYISEDVLKHSNRVISSG